MDNLIKENVSLKELTTFKIGGNARYYAEVKSEDELLEVSNFIKKNNLKTFVLGGGSDILVSDEGFDGIVIKYVGGGIKIEDSLVVSEAGVVWDDLVAFTVKNNFQGMECLSGIPGTVGASPIQNIGAYGQELKDTFIKLRAFELRTGKFIEFSIEDCQFDYRESIFKKSENWQKYLIVSVTFKLDKNGKPNIKYESLLNYFKEKGIQNPSLIDTREAVIELRTKKLEDPKKIGNAGSFFKNPIIEKDKLDKLSKDYLDIPNYPFGDKYKLFAAWLIEKAGWKGKSFNEASVSSKNSLILTNPKGDASSDDVYELCKKIQKDVSDKFGINLTPEVQFIGFKKKIAILGYGIEGEDAERYLKRFGEEVTILDRKFDEKYLDNLDSFDMIIRSPGVYRYFPEIVKAEKDGVEITSAIKIFFDVCPAKIIGVTGTKGKGTTSTLIYEILKAAGKDVYLAGNIGKPYLELLSKLTEDSFVILELSSFQLIDLTKSPYIAVVLDITLDHMDWHKDKEEYINAKKNIVKHQAKDDFAVINSEYEISKSFSELTKGKVVFFEKSKLEDKFKERLLLKGEHNLENIAAAVSVSKVLGINEEIILKVVQSFKGLEHRLERIKEVNGVIFYNDSFATGPQPTIAAIKSFIEPITLILGGSDKGLNYNELGKEITINKQVKKVIIIGQVGPLIIKSLNEAGYRGSIINLKQKSMVSIVENAFRNTSPGGIILLSPAAASFDMFKNYKDRGNKFKEAVQSLK